MLDGTVPETSGRRVCAVRLVGPVFSEPAGGVAEGRTNDPPAFRFFSSRRLPAAWSVMAGLVFLFLAFETKGRSIEEIDADLMEPETVKVRPV